MLKDQLFSLHVHQHHIALVVNVYKPVAANFVEGASNSAAPESQFCYVHIYYSRYRYCKIDSHFFVIGIIVLL